MVFLLPRMHGLARNL